MYATMLITSPSLDYHHHHQQQVDEQCHRVFDSLYATRLEERKRHIREMKARAARGSSTSGASRRRSAQLELPSLDQAYIQELDHLCYGYDTETGGVYLHLDRALVHLSYAHGSYERVHLLIHQMASFIPPWLETEIETIWDHASYHIYGTNILLNSVNKYRIRKRVVCPTVLKSGGKKYKLSQEANKQLSQHFAINSKPDRATREHLSNLLGVSMPTISNWFKNRRQRVRFNLNCSLSSSSQSSVCTSTSYSSSSSSSSSGQTSGELSPKQEYIEPEQPIHQEQNQLLIQDTPAEIIRCKEEPVFEDNATPIDTLFPTILLTSHDMDLPMMEELMYEISDGSFPIDFCY